MTNIKWILAKQVEILQTAGARKVWTESIAVEDSLPSRHLMGTCRMGHDPARSVVDAHSRTHDVSNLYLVDGCNFVTSARQQPTATIQALAYRAAEHAAQAAKASEL